MTTFRVTLLIGLLALLQACVGIPTSKPIDNPALQAMHQRHLQNLSTITAFTLQGRIGVQTEGKGFSGSLTWQHNISSDDIALYSPLGGQVASIKKTANNVTLEDAKGNSISAADVETLTQNALGWKLPLTGLADWSLGRPATGEIQASTLDEQGHLNTLKQEGWDIEYQNYTEQNGHFLPKKIILRNDKAHLKLLVENWRIVGN